MHIIVRQLRSALLLSTLVCAGCFGVFDESPDAAPAELSFALQISQPSFSGTNFEQYRLLPTGLFVECGRIVRGQHKVKQQGVLAVSPATRQAIQARVEKILDTMAEDEAPVLSLSGGSSVSPDGSRFVFTVGTGSESREIQGSLVDIRSGAGELPMQLHAFAQIVRGIPRNAPCGLEIFYGVGRSEL